jgi:hypothetical protein
MVFMLVAPVGFGINTAVPRSISSNLHILTAHEVRDSDELGSEFDTIVSVPITTATESVDFALHRVIIMTIKLVGLDETLTSLATLVETINLESVDHFS